MDTESSVEENRPFDAQLKIPFPCIAAGAPLSGKTTFLRRLLEERHRLIDKSIGKVVWFYGQGTDFVRMKEYKLHNLPFQYVKGLPKSFDNYIVPDKILIVIDDLMQSDGNSVAVTNLFCNKVQHEKLSIILLLQNLFHHRKERTTMVRCSQYLVVFKNPMDRSIPLYLSHKLIPLKKTLFMEMFERVTSKAHGYLFCDGKQDTRSVHDFAQTSLTEVCRRPTRFVVMQTRRKQKVDIAKRNAKILLAFKHKDYLTLFSKAKNRSRRDKLVHLADTAERAVSKCIQNILQGNVPLQSQHLKQMKRYKNLLRSLAKTFYSVKKKKSLLKQKGSFIGALIPLAVSALRGIIPQIIKSITA